jgi:hypothetical protein
MPLDLRLVGSNVLPDRLRRVEPGFSGLAFRDLVALSAGHDFLLQASNSVCADVAFGSVHMPWLTGRLDGQAVAALRASNASFASTVLRQAVEASIAVSGAEVDVLLLFSAHDVLFDGEAECRVRLGVRVALGSHLVVPKEPGLVHGLKPGEAVESVSDAVSRVGQALLAAGTALTGQTLATRTLADIRPGPLAGSLSLNLDPGSAIFELSPRHVDLGDRNSFDVSAWLGGGVVEIAAPFAATGDQPSATVRVAADVSQSSAHFTELSHDAGLLLSDADPLGLVQTATHRVRQRSRLALVNDVSLVGGPATATVPHLGALAPDTFPCSRGACALNVGATIAPGRVAARNAAAFIGSSRYGVIWSADAVKLLVRFCWETGAFPRNIMQVQPAAVRLKVDGVEQIADSISDFHLDTLDVIELEYDANGRTDVLYTRGLSRVIPRLLRLNDGRELVPKDPNDPLFAPSDPNPWAALGELTEQTLSASSSDVLWFERAVTRGVTARLGRPFTEPNESAVVTESHISAPAQRVALLVT